MTTGSLSQQRRLAIVSTPHGKFRLTRSENWLSRYTAIAVAVNRSDEIENYALSSKGEVCALSSLKAMGYSAEEYDLCSYPLWLRRVEPNKVHFFECKESET